ncbi:hypothetical protein GOODEAATRI_013613 [Goodea atripinnis]|uniref:Uncharacterized protein n=1 Tax=Goodea atripinnis TaxID=208336 RepID=A0ABV0NUG2_9TELE
MIGMSLKGCLTLEIFLECPTRRKPWSKPRTLWRHSVTGKSNVKVFHLEGYLYHSISDKWKTVDAWIPFSNVLDIKLAEVRTFRVNKELTRKVRISVDWFICVLTLIYSYEMRVLSIRTRS